MITNAKLYWILFAIIASAYGIHISYAYLTQPPTPQEIQTGIDKVNNDIISHCDNDATTHATGSTTRLRELDANRLKSLCLKGLMEDFPSGQEIQNQKQMDAKINNEGNTSATGSVNPVPPKPVSIKTIIQSSNEKVITWANGSKGASNDVSTIQAMIWLPECRIVQEEHNHYNRDRGSVYATDIACEKWKSFTVVSPLWKKEYIVHSVGTDKRLGDYIILKNGEYLFVFGHTTSSHKVWEKITAGVQIWYTNLSGISQNYHVHFELWRDGYNITSDELFGKWSEWNTEHSFALLRQRGWYTGVDDAIDFITSFEGFRSKAYEDPKGSGHWSIGYGTSSFEGETISKQEAKDCIRDHITEVMQKIYTDRLAITPNERIAVTSALYNLGSYSDFTKTLASQNRKEIYAEWTEWRMKWTIYENGLMKRRIKERDLFFISQ